MLCQAIVVLITDFILFDDADYYHRFALHDPDHGIGLTDIEVVHTFELPKLPAQRDGTAQWDWLKFISVRTEKELDMTPTSDPALARAVTIVKHFNADEAEQHRQLSHEMWVHDQASRIHAAEQRGLARGVEQGVVEGRRASARNALDLGLSVAEVAKVSGLSSTEVVELAGRPE